MPPTRSRRRLPVVAAALTAGAALLAGLTAAAPAQAVAAGKPGPPHTSCAQEHRGQVRCLSTWRRPAASATRSRVAGPKPPKGLGPAEIRSAYQLPRTGGAGRTVAVVGSNGYCGGDHLCTGVKGYDGPTGLGSPRGLKAL